MNLTAMEIPDDPARLPGWLEEQIVGLHLGELVAELRAIHGSVTASQTADNLDLARACEDRLPDVLETGLALLPRTALRNLLCQPQLLLDLQQEVFISGGDYWRTVRRTDEHQARVAAGWMRLQSGPPSPPPARGRHRRTLVAAMALATALTLLLGWWLQAPQELPWGWNRPGMFTAALAQEAYLEQLAAGADEWFQQPRETRAELQQRLREFRQACDQLLAAAHPQLEPALREELLKRCRNWATKFDEQLAQLEADADVAEVRQAADETVTRLVGAIRSGFGMLAANAANRANS